MYLSDLHNMFILRAVFILLFYECFTQTQALNALNNYGDIAYPGRCAVDMGNSVVLLKFAESFKLESLPCTRIYCMGDGWGMLQTCDYVPAPSDCRYTSFKNWKAEFPHCCKRFIRCD